MVKSRSKKAGLGLTVGTVLLLAYSADQGIGLMYLFDMIPPLWFERVIALGILSVMLYMLFSGKDEDDRMIMAIPFGLVEMSMYESFMAQLWEKTPLILAWAIVMLTYELSKKASRGISRRIGESMSSRWAVLIYFVLISAFVYTLYLQGYLGSP